LGRPQASFVKRQREQQRREKAAAKAEKRAQKKTGEKSGGPEIIPDEPFFSPSENDAD
jgi:hypothetical protein